MTLPGPDVIAAFGLSGRPVRLPGGQGESVRVGEAVLKPAGEDTGYAQWLAGVMASVVEDGFRVARPLRAADGGWCHGGWTASAYVPGAAHPAAPRWGDILAAGRAFGRALAGVPRPALLAGRDDPWAVGDRVAWREQDADVLPELHGPYAELAALAGPPPDDRAQLVHGDLAGNVLFAPELPPAVIDFSPYWRPPAFAEAIVVADALLWYGAGSGLLDATLAANGPAFRGYVARALVFRLVTDSERFRAPGAPADVPSEARRYARAARLLRDRT
ncbi:aminoglycoside phosphotransferase [Streptomyces sp. NPDC021020]|uniref:aminoglycoside phosphotransferase n=1 Tax=Streptomyces sp. NPDC021020 TaxID=3365109 RepID=UPI0037990131